MSNVAHLHKDMLPLLEESKAERILACQLDRWIGYPRATDILKRLDDLIVYPKTLRMENLLVVGRSGNGKSALIDRFFNRHAVQQTELGTALVPIVRIEMPETPDESELWSLILWHLGISHREREPAHIKKRQVKSLMLSLQVRILVIDEFNNLTRAGKAAGDLLAAIKGLSNDLKLSVVAAGTQEAVNALNSDPQMRSRFQPAILDRWILNTEYLRFLSSYEQLLPLKNASNLASRELAPSIYGMAGDTVGGAVRLLKKASVKAIESGVEKITKEVLADLDWTRSDQWDEVGRRA